MKPKFNLNIVLVILALVTISMSCSGNGNTVNTLTPQQTTAPAGEIITTEPTQPVPEQPENLPPDQAEIQPAETVGVAEPTETPAVAERSSSTLGPCAEEVCVQDNPNLLLRPVGGKGRVTVDPSYRFGEFRKNSRYPNLGVEFLNSTGTPVIAAADGQVLVAGDDSQTAYTRSLNEYGNLIILEHNLAEIGQPVYTLYAHLSEVLVQSGDAVSAGQEIGKVGATGNIRGSVLHFEVRVGENTYSAVRNPELWLVNGQDENGQALGSLAGRISDSQGNIQDIRNIVVERLGSSGQSVIGRTYLRTYGGVSLWGQAPWSESFGMGDLLPGTYKLSFLLNGYQNRLVEVQAGKLTLISIVQ
jgi:murein DD-endopeptidase MepM/ murein hydrolase activator NlpD